jgi:5'-nucleotidase
LKRVQDHPLPPDTILNVNVPDVPADEIRGYQSTRLGQRHKAEPVIKALDPRGREIYWVGCAGPEQDAGPGTDFFAVRNNFVSVTPLQIDLTRYERVSRIAEWLPTGSGI